MKFLIVLVLVLACVSAFKLHSEEIFSRERFVPVVEHEGRITGGQDADITEFGYQVGLILQEFEDSPAYSCGGSRITTKHVLTAAHCTEGMNRITASFGSAEFQKGLKLVVIREQNCDSNPEKCNVIEHEGYNSTTLFNDISMIIHKEVLNSIYIWEIKLAQPSSDYEQYRCQEVIASGWGRMGDQSGTATHLQQVRLRVIGNGDCYNMFGPIVTKKNICASTSYGEERRSTCPGDSGGPLALANKNKKDRVLIGVTSFGPRNGCQLGFPVAFTSVSAQRTWIKAKTGI